MNDIYMQGWTMEELKQEIQAEIKRLGGEYTPEWRFSKERPDIGSVIALLFAEQAAAVKYEQRRFLGRMRQELVKMLKISALPASPARMLLVIKAGEEDTDAYLAAGSRFQAEAGEGEEPVTFETEQPLCVTRAQIKAVIYASEDAGEITSMHRRKEYVNNMHISKNKMSDIHIEKDLAEGEYTSALCLYHSWMFEGTEGETGVHFEELQCMERDVDMRTAAAEWEFWYETESGRMPVPGVRKEAQALYCKRMPGARGLVAGRTPEKDGVLYMKGSYLTAAGRNLIPDFVSDGEEDLSGEQIRPFGTELTEYGVCYIGQEEAFSQKGAHAVVSFSLRFGRSVPGIQEKMEDLRLIKRAPMQEEPDEPLEVFVSEVILEYYNGLGFRKLACAPEAAYLFRADKSLGEAVIRFQIPGDWTPIQVGGCEGRALRIRIKRADGCYLRPSVHRYPIIGHIRVSYDYGGQRILPELIERRIGAHREAVPAEKGGYGRIRLFSPFPYAGESVYFGLDRSPGRGPAAVFLDIQENSGASRRRVRYEYLGPQGYKKLQTADSTDGLRIPGLVRFLAPEDLREGNVEGIKAYWLRMVFLDAGRAYRPAIRGACMNGVPAVNQEHRKPQEYYMDEVTPHMTFVLSGNQILYVDVWVNEGGYLKEEERRRILRMQPEKVRAEYDLTGQIQRFFVKWEERPDFRSSGPEDRHYIFSRQERRLIFGDGVHVRMPENTGDLTFYAEVTDCEGSRGNVKAMSVLRAIAPRAGAADVWNPYPAYGGMDPENKGRVEHRAGTCLGTGGRLVTCEDYIRETYAYSDGVKEAYARAADGCLKLYLLMKDWVQGTASFLELAGSLKRHLESMGSPLYRGRKLRLLLPCFLKISLELWVEAGDWNAFLNEQEGIYSRICEFFSPGRKACMGAVPGEGQIQMLLASLRMHGRIRQHSVQVSFTDEYGEHEIHLAEAGSIPFAVCVNGDHKIHMT